MSTVDLTFIGIAVTIVAIAIPLGMLVSGPLLKHWNQLAAIYPGGPLATHQTVRFIQIMIIRDSKNLLTVGPVRLAANDEYLGLSMSNSGNLDILLPRDAVMSCVGHNEGIFFLFASQEMMLRNWPNTICFRGRGARFVRRWWNKT